MVSSQDTKILDKTTRRFFIEGVAGFLQNRHLVGLQHVLGGPGARPDLEIGHEEPPGLAVSLFIRACIVNNGTKKYLVQCLIPPVKWGSSDHIQDISQRPLVCRLLLEKINSNT